MIKKDNILRLVVKCALRTVKPKKIWLFGSRAREDNSSRSDYDIAIEATNYKKWGQFVAECEEVIPTLCELNLVRFDSVSEKIRESILKEGIVLYDKHKVSAGS